MSTSTPNSGRFLLALAATLGLALAGCSEGTGAELPLPEAERVEAAYVYPGGLEARISGNVAEVRITQSPDHLRRGGRLWAKVGPYILLFTDGTFQLFEDYPGLAGVRVVTQIPDGTEVARATLAHDALTGVQWRRALNITGRARRDGTERVTLLEDLVEWGEDHAEFEYNPRYMRR